MLIYIHGFNSSALSYKAGLLREHLVKLGLGDQYACPELPHRPAQAIALLRGLLEGRDPESVMLVGSSLGGFYATWLVEHRFRRALMCHHCGHAERRPDACPSCDRPPKLLN